MLRNRPNLPPDALQNFPQEGEAVPRRAREPVEQVTNSSHVGVIPNQRMGVATTIGKGRFAYMEFD